MATLTTKIQIRRDTEDNLSNIVLEAGEICCAVDDLASPSEVTKFSIGTGITPFRALPNLMDGIANKGIYFIVGDHSSTTDNTLVWHGPGRDIKEVYSGLSIIYMVPDDGSVYGVNLDIDGFVESPIYRNDKPLTTELHRGDIVLLTYLNTETGSKWVWDDADSASLHKQYGNYIIAKDPEATEPETQVTHPFEIAGNQLVFVNDKKEIIPSLKTIKGTVNTIINPEPFKGFDEIFFCIGDFKEERIIRDSSSLKQQGLVSLKQYEELLPSLSLGPLFLGCELNPGSIDEFLIYINKKQSDFSKCFYTAFNEIKMHDEAYNEEVKKVYYIYLGQIVDTTERTLELSLLHPIYHYDSDLNSFVFYAPNKFFNTIAVQEMAFKTINIVQDIEANYDAEKAKDELVSRKAVYDFVEERQGTKLNQTQIDNINSIPNKANTEDVNAGLSLKVNKAGDEMTGPLTIAAGDGKGILFKDRTSNINISEDSQTKTLLGFLNNNFTIGHPSINTTIRGAQTYLTGNNLDIGNTGNSGLIAKGVSCHTDYTTIHTKQGRALFIQEGESGVVNIGGTPSTTAAQDMSAKLIVNGDIKEGTQNLSDKYQAKGNYLTEHQDISGKADKTYVNTELGKKANTTDIPTITLNGKTTKTPDFVAPINEGEIKTKFRIANKGYSETVVYYPLVKLPINNSGNYASLLISGRIGGWVDNNMSFFQAIVYNRGTCGISVFDIAGSGVPSDIYDLSDIVIYQEEDNSATVYIKATRYFTYDIDIEVFQSSAQIIYNGETKIPTGVLKAQASTTTSRFELYQGKATINGEQVATTTELTNGLNSKQQKGDYVTTLELNNGLAGRQPKGNYATTTALTDGLNSRQPRGDYATNKALTDGLAGKQPKGNYATTTELNNGLASKQPKGNYATTTEVNAKVSLADVSNAGFIKNTTNAFNYNNLSNKPTIPTNTNQLTNGAGFITNTTNAFNYNNLKGKPTATETWKSLQDMVLNAVYPVGSVYITMDVESPANLFGGTWEPLPGEAALWVIAANTIIKYKETIPVRQGELPQFTGWGIRGGQDGTSGGIVHKKSIQLSNANAGKYGANYEIDSVLESNSIYTNKKNLVKPTHVIVHAWVRVG